MSNLNLNDLIEIQIKTGSREVTPIVLDYLKEFEKMKEYNLPKEYYKGYLESLYRI